MAVLNSYDDVNNNTDDLNLCIVSFGDFGETEAATTDDTTDNTNTGGGDSSDDVVSFWHKYIR